MKIGDLVRPKSSQFRDQIGIVITVGFLRGFGGIGVRLVGGRIATYNRGSLEIVSEG
jgi:hypothetical protein